MKIAIGSDERTHLTDAVVVEVEKRGHEVLLFGPLADRSQYWPKVAQDVAESVAEKQADEGILFCWTGTGVSLAANRYQASGQLCVMMQRRHGGAVVE